MTVRRGAHSEGGTDYSPHGGRFFYEGDQRNHRTDHVHRLCQKNVHKEEARGARKRGYCQIPA